jgi:hypothetical protein
MMKTNNKIQSKVSTNCGVLTSLTTNSSSSWSVRSFFLTVLFFLGPEGGYHGLNQFFLTVVIEEMTMTGLIAVLPSVLHHENTTLSSLYIE